LAIAILSAMGGFEVRHRARSSLRLWLVPQAQFQRDLVIGDFVVANAPSHVDTSNHSRLRSERDAVVIADSMASGDRLVELPTTSDLT